ncbi:MAG: NAD(P)H-quinone oxidoreductase [Acidobacteriota bacterium]
MKAVFITEFGTGDNLVYQDVPDLRAPIEDEAIVRVHAAGLNRADLLQRRGAYPPPAGYSPYIPGLEFAGVIAAVGRDVDRCRIGDRVFGITSGEGQAEYLLADARHLARIPDNLSFNEAAAIPEAFMTAYDAVFAQGKIKEGETLLIHAVGSGVGLAAMQLATSAGALVIGTSRTDSKLSRCKKLGLIEGIQIGAEPDFAESVIKITAGVGADVILDLVGAAYFEQNLEALAIKGRLILVGLTSGRQAEFNLGLALQKRATIIGTILRARAADEKAQLTQLFSTEVLPLLSDGRVTPNLDMVFAATDVFAAYQYLESNQSFGKVVLEF